MTAIPEIAPFEFQGQTFVAQGSLIDEENGIIRGYVSGDGKELRAWAGGVICPLKLISSFRCRPFRPGDRLYCYQAVFNGRTYSGRGSGPMMILHLRARKSRKG